MCNKIKTEKELLVGFVIFIMQEFGMVKNITENSRDIWLQYPISGVRQAANDMLEATQDISNKELSDLDTKLTYLNLPTVTNMRQKGFKKLLQILSRDCVKNEDEWRILRSFSESDMLNKNVLSKTQELLNSFEPKPKST